MGQIGRYLDNALAMKIVHQSRLYENLLKARSDKSKLLKNAPPVIRPGANVPSDKGRTVFQKARTEIKKAGREGNSNRQENLMVSMLNSLYK